MHTNPLAEKITDAEAEIMKVLWHAGHAIPFSKIRSAMQSKDPGKDSPTINTLINRLVKKGVLSQERRDVYYYSPLVTEAEYQAFKTQFFVDRVYDGDVQNLMASLVSGRQLTQVDLDELREILKREGEGDA